MGHLMDLTTANSFIDEERNSLEVQLDECMKDVSAYVKIPVERIHDQDEMTYVIENAKRTLAEEIGIEVLKLVGVDRETVYGRFGDELCLSVKASMSPSKEKLLAMMREYADDLEAAYKEE